MRTGILRSRECERSSRNASNSSHALSVRPHYNRANRDCNMKFTENLSCMQVDVLCWGLHSDFKKLSFPLFYRHRNKRRTKFEVSLRTAESNGLLLWLKRGKNPQGNFVAVAINNGFPELNMKLGRHIPLLTIRSQVRFKFKYCVLT